MPGDLCEVNVRWDKDRQAQAGDIGEDASHYWQLYITQPSVGRPGAEPRRHGNYAQAAGCRRPHGGAGPGPYNNR